MAVLYTQMHYRFLKGLCHEIEFKQLDKRTVLVVYKVFRFTKCSSEEMSFPKRFKNHVVEVTFLGDISTEFLCGLRCFLLVHCVKVRKPVEVPIKTYKYPFLSKYFNSIS